MITWPGCGVVVCGLGSGGVGVIGSSVMYVVVVEIILLVVIVV